MVKCVYRNMKRTHIKLTGEALSGGAIKLTFEQATELGIDTAKDEIHGHMKTWGPWQIPVSYRALCTSSDYTPESERNYTAQRDAVHYYGFRTMCNCVQSGYAMEGRVSVNGKSVRAFTSSDLVELPDGKLISIATIHACI